MTSVNTPSYSSMISIRKQGDILPYSGNAGDVTSGEGAGRHTSRVSISKMMQCCKIWVLCPTTQTRLGHTTATKW